MLVYPYYQYIIVICQKDGWTPLHCAANAGHLDVVKHLVDSGASTKAETSNGRTPLWSVRENLN